MNVEHTRALLSRPWHVVVGNPPYITVKDPAGAQKSRTVYASTPCRPDPPLKRRPVCA